MKYLFTAVGYTDPVRDYYDGAILHIIRHYKVEKVFLFFTATTWEEEEQSHMYKKG